LGVRRKTPPSIEVSNEGGVKMANGYNWLLDEVASAGRENRDVKHASQYDVKEDAGALEELTLLQKLGLNGQSEVVDIGAGTGQFALAAALACARVVAVDVSPVMLAVLKTKVGVSGLSNVKVVQAGFLTLNTTGGEPTSCIPATRSITFLTSGRPWPFNDFGVLFDREACFGCGMSSTTSTLQQQRIALRGGVRRSAMTRGMAGPGPTSKSTSAMNTRPSPGS
jgi:SAM-dependent methyltransferase